MQNRESRNIDFPTVSIIVPVLNVEEYLGQCLESIKCQTYSSYEVICVDGGSSDGSLQILKEFAEADERFKVVEEHCSSVGEARNKGFSFSKGKYIAFIDGDDYAEKELLASTITRAEETASEVVCFPCTRYDSISDQKREGTFCLTGDQRIRKSVFSKEDIPDRIFQITDRYPFSRVYLRDFLFRNDIRFSSSEYYGEIGFSFLVMGKAKMISCVEEPLYCHRRRKGSTLRRWNNADDLLDTMISAYKALSKDLTDEKQKASFICQAIANIHSRFCASPVQTFRDAVMARMEEGAFKEIYSFYEGREELPYYKKVYPMLETLHGAANRKRKIEKARTKETALCLRKASATKDCRVSIIIPVYQSKQFLSETLDSVLGQSFQDFELICINDGSTDRSLDILLEYAEKDRRITVYTQSNSGQGKARNVGIQSAVGKYLYFIDSDDLMKAGALEEIVNAADTYQLDLLCFNADWFYDQSCTEEEYRFKPNYHKSYDYPPVTTGEDLFVSLCENGDYRVPVYLMLFKRYSIINSNLLFQNGVIHEDESFSYQTFIFAERAGYLKRSLYNRRIRRGSTMTSGDCFRSAYGYFSAGTKMLSVYEERKPYLKEKTKAWSMAKIEGEFNNSRRQFQKCSDYDAAGVYASCDYSAFRNVVVEPVRNTAKEKDVLLLQKERLSLELQKVKEEQDSLKSSRLYKILVKLRSLYRKRNCSGPL